MTHKIRSIDVVKVDFCTYAVNYAPWVVIRLSCESDAVKFAAKLREALEAKPFNDWDIGHVLRVRNEIYKAFPFRLAYVDYGD